MQTNEFEHGVIDWSNVQVSPLISEELDHLMQIAERRATGKEPISFIGYRFKITRKIMLHLPVLQELELYPDVATYNQDLGATSLSMAINHKIQSGWCISGVYGGIWGNINGCEHYYKLRVIFVFVHKDGRRDLIKAGIISKAGVEPLLEWFDGD